MNLNPILRELLSTGRTVLENGESVPLHSGVKPATVALIDRVIEEVRPEVTLEVGLAYGVSALAICTALDRCGGKSHIVIDPNQHRGPWGDSWQGGGLYNLRRAGFGDLFTFHEKASHIALPELEARGARVQFALIDGWCTFDHRLTDFLLIDRLLDVGGMVMMAAADLPSVRKACRFIATNRAYAVYKVVSIPHDHEVKARRYQSLRGLDVPESVRRHFKPELREPDGELGFSAESDAIVFRKESEDDRHWDHFEEF